MRLPSKRFTRISIVFVLLAALAIIILFVPPPQFALRPMIVASAPYLLDERQHDSKFTRAAKELMRTYTNVGTCYHLAHRVLKQGGSDEEILGRMLAQARTIIVSPRAPEKIRHDTVAWPALISGVGYCDQINAVVCRMAAHHFPNAELVALYQPDGRLSPHTIGRVWSRERNEWLYFDAFYARPVIFTRDAKGTPHFLTVNAGPVMNSRVAMSPAIYSLQGWPLSEFASTFGTYLWARLYKHEVSEPPTIVTATRQPKDDAAPRTPSAGILPGRPAELIVAPVVLSPVRQRNPKMFSSIVRQYAQVRVEHLFGTPDRNAYRAIAQKSRNGRADDRVAEIASIACRLAAN